MEQIEGGEQSREIVKDNTFYGKMELFFYFNSFANFKAHFMVFCAICDKKFCVAAALLPFFIISLLLRRLICIVANDSLVY